MASTQHRFPRLALLGAVVLALAPAGRAGPPGFAITVNAPHFTDDAYDGSNHPSPPMPAGAIAQKLGGQVELTVTTAKTGKVNKVSVLHSSGSPYLDEAARCWVQFVWQYPRSAAETTHAETVTFAATQDDLSEEADALTVGRSIYPDSPRPTYPYVANRAGWQGGVGLTLVPAANGRVQRALILKSSGYPLLDLTAQCYAEAYWKLPSKKTTVALVTFHLLTLK